MKLSREKMKKLTPYFIIITIVIIAIYDFWIITVEGKLQSVSAVLIRWSYEYPSFTFLMGFTFGHLFWKMKDKDLIEDKNE